MTTHHLAGRSMFLSPLVRRLVAEHGLDIGAINGTGRDGRVRRDDVLELVAQRRRSDRPTPGTSASMGAGLGGATTAIMAVELDLTGSEGHSRSTLLARLAAASSAARIEHRSAPPTWASVLVLRHPDTAQTVDIADAGDLSEQGIAHRLDAAAQRPGHGARQTRLAVGVVSARGILHEVGPLVDVVGSLLLGTASRRAAVVETATGEALAIRSVATLTLGVDTEVVTRLAAAAWLLAVCDRWGASLPRAQHGPSSA